MLGFGLGVGLGAIALLGVGGWLGQGLCLLVIGLALRLGWNAEPVLVGAPIPPSVKKPEPEPEPEPEPTPELKPKQPMKKPEPDWPLQQHRLIVDIVGLLEMMELPGGIFQMGSPDSDNLAGDWEKPQHPVIVSAFAIACYPVTRKLYREIIGRNQMDLGSINSVYWLYWEIIGRNPEQWKERSDDQLPANYVNWFDAVNFCNALSEKQGLQLCYHRTDGDQVNWDRKANGYRLPTEAEWEYAVRAGTTTRWFFGDNDAGLGRYAWFKNNSGNQVRPVGKKEANPWGLHDMIGNVWEWCWDQYGDYPKYSPTIDPLGSSTGVSRVLRGGAYWDGSGGLRSADRFDDWPENRLERIGFRCVRGPRRQP